MKIWVVVSINCLDIISLLSLEGIGRKRVGLILKQYRNISLSIKDIYEILKDKNYYFTLKELYQVYEKSKNIIEELNQSKIHMIDCLSTAYPDSLRKIEDPPLLLFIKGYYDFIYNEKNCLAVIGSREPTKKGKKTAYNIARYLARKKFSIISGLALGCDTQAHLACLKEKGRTAAILAHGLNMIYPKENEKLAEDIIDKGGCLISEYLPYEKAKNYTFIERDRLQSALSQAVIVIETEETGGTMHTVRFAKKQNKLLACVQYTPEQMQDYKLSGNKIILNELNAIPVRNYEDLDDLITYLRENKS